MEIWRVTYCSFHPEKVVQVYGFCIHTLRLPVISVMIIGVMRLSYNERAGGALSSPNFMW